MNTEKILLTILIIATMTLAACVDDDNDEPAPTPTPTPTVDDNANKNDASANALLARLEFPKVRGGRSEVVCHTTDEYGLTYALEWDHDLKAQRWTCFEIDARNCVIAKLENGQNASRNAWWPNGDPWAYDSGIVQSEQQATYNELSKSYYPGAEQTSANSYQKGHICASQDRMYAKAANEQTFYMTNILPMVGNFNGNLWEKLESKVRSWGSTTTVGDTLFVVKGGTIQNVTIDGTLTNYILDHTIGGHIVPRYFFMALLSKKQGALKAIGFWMEHLNEDHSADALSNYAVNIRELEEKTGIDFFCNLPDIKETQVETVERSKMLSEWGFVGSY